MPLIGASIVVKGTSNGTITDVDGNFSISVPKSGTVLVISYVGMATQEITVNSSKPIKVVLNPDSEVLADVARRRWAIRYRKYRVRVFRKFPA